MLTVIISYIVLYLLCSMNNLICVYNSHMHAYMLQEFMYMILRNKKKNLFFTSVSSKTDAKETDARRLYLFYMSVLFASVEKKPTRKSCRFPKSWREKIVSMYMSVLFASVVKKSTRESLYIYVSLYKKQMRKYYF